MDTLGLFHDHNPLHANTFRDHLVAEKRKFRTGAFVPFSANIAFVLHDCGNGESSGSRKGKLNVVSRLLDGTGDSFVANASVADRFFVQLLLNERPMKFPSLCGRSICSYSELRDYYSSFIDRCHFQQKCEIHTEP